MILVHSEYPNSRVVAECETPDEAAAVMDALRERRAAVALSRIAEQAATVPFPPEPHEDHLSYIGRIAKARAAENGGAPAAEDHRKSKRPGISARWAKARKIAKREDRETREVFSELTASEKAR